MLDFVVPYSYYWIELVRVTVQLVHTLSKTGKHDLLTVWWPQSRGMRMYPGTFFVDDLFPFPLLSGRPPLLRSTHRGGLDAQCCLSLYRLHCYTECSLRTFNKCLKQYRVETFVGNLPNAPLNRFQLPIRVSLTNQLHSSYIRDTTSLRILSTI